MSRKPAVLETPEELLHVFDLPQIHQRPSAEQLLDTLALLAVQTRSWDVEGDSIPKRQRVAPDGVAKYLTSIVSSPLKWIPLDSTKEAVWEAASSRLAERSGRTAMPAMTRTFSIPKPDGGRFALEIHEPTMTGDAIGHKTWGASYLLAKRLHTLIGDLPSPPHGEARLRVLELGAGTGLVGLACAAGLGADVLLTDLPEIEENLARNVSTNQGVIRERGGTAGTAILDWSRPGRIMLSTSARSVMMAALDSDFTYPDSGSSSPTSNTTGSTPTPTPTPAPSEFAKFPLILAADSIYSPSHPALLTTAVMTWLSYSASARFVIELPCREGYGTEREDLRRRLMGVGLRVLDEGWEKGRDDWGDGEEVECWWAAWGWADLS